MTAAAEMPEDVLQAAREAARKKIIETLLDFPHSIDSGKVEIRFDARRPGHNALNQFLTALEEHFTAAPKGGAE